ncbi:MAG: YybH family protein [Sphingomonas sp.]|jgi:ketosteroid isomerase-like protein
MRAIQTILVAVALLAAPALATPRDEAAIIAHGKQWSALYEAGKIEEMRALYEPDAWLMTEGAPAAKGVDSILAFLKRNKASANTVAFAFAPEQITIDGPRGYLVSKYWMAIDTPAGQHIESAGRSFLVFKRGRNGTWRIWRDIDNRAPDVTPADRPKSGTG